MDVAPPTVVGRYEYSSTDVAPPDRPLPLSVSITVLGAVSLACWGVIFYVIHII